MPRPGSPRGERPRGGRWWWFLAVLVWVGGCARGGATPTVAPSPTPTLPPVVTVQRPPVLAGWDARLSACASRAGLLLAIDGLGVGRPDAWQLTWPPLPPEAQAAYALEPTTWVVLVAADNPAPGPVGPAWRRLWTDPEARWRDVSPRAAGLAPPVPVVPPADSRWGALLTQALGPAWPWHPRARLAVRPGQMARLVAVEPAALALVPARWAEAVLPRLAEASQVRVLPVSAGVFPTPQVVLWRATAPGPAEGHWLACLQGP